MAHKRKINDPPKEKLRPDQYQESKKKYYDNLYGFSKNRPKPALLEQLKQEYATEQTHLQKISKDKHILGVIKSLLGELESGKIPVDYVMRNYEGGWGIPINKTRAHDVLLKEKREFEGRIGIQEQQMKLAVERQIELRSKIFVFPVFEHD